MQRWSQLFIPTLREAPADAEVASHALLLRAGYIRQLGAGLYSFLPLGQRSINKIVAIIRQEMDTIAQEFFLPALLPRELWEESGRWQGMGDNMFRLKDRKGADLCLGMTHEEVMTSIARNELRSYKQLPQIWYQIQTKFRDEPRPKSGLLRVRQFTMKDAYSFDIDEAGLDLSYQKHDQVYRRIFTRCGLQFVAVEADSGAMGGSQSQEFMVYTEAGEDLIASARNPAGEVVYAANLEKATSTLAPVIDLEPTGTGIPELVHTPGKASIADVTEFFGIHASQDIKCVAFMGSTQNGVILSGAQSAESKDPHLLRPVVAFLRGDHSVNETKLNAIAGTTELRPMTPEELALHVGGPAGFLGPIGIPQVMTQGSLNGINSGKPIDRLKGVLRDDPAAQHLAPTLKTIVIQDLGLVDRHNLVGGANQLDYHYRNITPGRDYTPTLTADIRNILEGEADPIQGYPLRLGKAVEIGHIFKLGYKYSKSMGATVLNRDGKEVTPIMGSYGIGVERILTAAIESSAAAFSQGELSSFSQGELSSFAEGGGPASPSLSFRGAAEEPASRPAPAPQFVLPAAIAPFHVIVTITNIKESALVEAAEKIASDLTAAGLDVLLDDRDERAGVKFKDADLTGIPYRIAVGKKLAEGHVELLNRLAATTTDLPVSEVVAQTTVILSEATNPKPRSF